MSAHPCTAVSYKKDSCRFYKSKKKYYRRYVDLLAFSLLAFPYRRMSAHPCAAARIVNKTFSY